MKDEKHIDIIRNFRKENDITPKVLSINILQNRSTQSRHPELVSGSPHSTTGDAETSSA